MEFLLENITDEEREIWVKKNQLVFILENKNRSKYEPKYELTERIFKKSDWEIDDLYEKFEHLIKKEIWVELYSSYYHFTELDKVLLNRLQYFRENPEIEIYKDVNVMTDVDKFMLSIQKTSYYQLSLEEKEDLYRITNLVTY